MEIGRSGIFFPFPQCLHIGYDTLGTGLWHIGAYYVLRTAN